MRLKSVHVKGFECIGHNPGIHLQDLSKGINIFIGPNNVGKSSLFRALWVASDLIKSTTSGNELALTAAGSFPKSNWLNYDLSKNIEIELVVDGEGFHTQSRSGVGGMDFPSGQYSRFLFTLISTGPENFVISPFIHLTSQQIFLPLLNVDSNRIMTLAPNNNYQDRMDYEKNFAKSAQPILSDLVHSQRFFDPVRTLKKNLGNSDFVDGSKLIPDLYKRQHDTNDNNSFYRLRKNILSRVNSLLGSSGTAPLDEFEVKGTEENPVLFLTQGEISTPISSMGTGISELFFICASLILDENKTVQYFLEEPETHLHPALLRRLFQLFSEYTNVQFFINTHSNVLLDCLSDTDRVYQWSRNTENESSASLCTTLHDYHTILDHLGIRASSLLQTNCTIWVEGPSDRIYLKRWMDEIAEDKQTPPLIEGSDYSIVFYGGTLRSHHTLDEEASPNLISLVRISRFSIVLMDRDLPPGSSDAELDKSKLRLMQEAAKYPNHRLAVVTTGREIENDLNSDNFLKAVEKKRKLGADVLNGFTLSGAKNYFDEIAEFLVPVTATEIEASEDKTKQTPQIVAAKKKRHTIRESLKEKVPLAEIVVSLSGASPIRPPYATAIYNHILSSRLDRQPTERSCR